MKRSVLITQSALAALLALVLYNSRGALSGYAMYVAALALIECFYAAHVMRRREAAAQCSAIRPISAVRSKKVLPEKPVWAESRAVGRGQH